MNRQFFEWDRGTIRSREVFTSWKISSGEIWISGRSVTFRENLVGTILFCGDSLPNARSIEDSSSGEALWSVECARVSVFGRFKVPLCASCLFACLFMSLLCGGSCCFFEVFAAWIIWSKTIASWNYPQNREQGHCKLHLDDLKPFVQRFNAGWLLCSSSSLRAWRRIIGGPWKGGFASIKDRMLQNPGHHGFKRSISTFLSSCRNVPLPLHHQAYATAATWYDQRRQGF